MSIITQCKKKQAGTGMIEVVLAIGIFVIFVTGMMVLVSRYLAASQRSIDDHDAHTILDETFEALQHMAYVDWGQLQSGTYGLVYIGGEWGFVPSPDTLQNKFSRAITITNIERDEQCHIVLQGGLDDAQTKKIGVALTWTQDERGYTRVSEQLFTDWRAESLCPGQEEGGGGGGGGQASELHVNTSGTMLINGSVLAGLTFQNTGSEPITIDKLTLSWDYAIPRYLYLVLLDGQFAWSAFGIGSPTWVQPSGTELDIVDVTLAPGELLNGTNWFAFNWKLQGSAFTLDIIMDDESVFNVPSFTPTY